MSDYVARVQADGGLWKTPVASHSPLVIKETVVIPASTLAAAEGEGFLGDLLQVSGSDNTDGLFANWTGSAWNWWTDLTGSSATGTVAVDTPTVLEVDLVHLTGTNWTLTWKADGVMLFTDAYAFDDATAGIRTIVGILDMDTMGPSIQIDVLSVEISNGSGTIYFSDGFSSGDTSAWDTTTGSVEVVHAGAFRGFPSVGDPEGVVVAYGDDAYNDSPDWKRIDTSAPDVMVTQIRTRRGRTYTTDQTGAGTAAVDFVDAVGALDPTNSTGPLYPMDPNCPMAVGLKNQHTGEWSAIFTGMVQSIPTSIAMNGDPATFSRGTLNGADMIALLARRNIPPGLDFDDTDGGTSTANTIGDTTYAAQDVQSRIKALLADAGVPPGLTNIFSGNVNVQASTEPPGTTSLEMIQNAADAEFPLVRNYYIDKTGVFNFKGRLARFNPTDPTYGINTWHVGDVPAVDAHSSWALIQAISFDRDIAKIINDGNYTPQGIADADIAGMEVTDAGSITQYGTGSTAGDALITAGGIGDGNDANDEVKLFNTFLVDNFHDAQTRIVQMQFTNPEIGAANEAAQWLLLCGVEISDVVVVTTTHPGGGGFNLESYFVEGISYTITPKTDDDPQVVMTLDLSPAAYYTTNPFS